MHKLTVIIADDNEAVRIAWEGKLSKVLNGYAIIDAIHCECAEDAVKVFQSGKEIDLCLMDINFKNSPKSAGLDGIVAAEQIRKLSPSVYILHITSADDRATSDRAFEAKVIDDYLRKSVDTNAQLKHIGLAGLTTKLQRQGKIGELEYRMVGSQSLIMQLTFRRIDKIGPDDNVFIRGETGTGKEFVAARINANAKFITGNPNRPFKKIDLSTFAETLREGELFGHVKGAYTGAIDNRAGAIAEAEGGDLFIDEVQNLSIDLQQKLLRFLNNKCYSPQGSDREIKANCRIIFAMNKDPLQLEREGRLLSDFLGRIRKNEIILAPLRARIEDIPDLVKHFSEPFSHIDRKIEPETIEYLKTLNYPKNLRDLSTIVEEAFKNVHVPFVTVPAMREIVETYMLGAAEPGEHHSSQAAPKMEFIIKELVSIGLPMPETIKKIEKECYARAAKKCKSVKELADSLNVTRKTARGKLNEFGITLGSKQGLSS